MTIHLKQHYNSTVLYTTVEVYPPTTMSDLNNVLEKIYQDNSKVDNHSKGTRKLLTYIKEVVEEVEKQMMLCTQQNRIILLYSKSEGRKRIYLNPLVMRNLKLIHLQNLIGQTASIQRAIWSLRK